MERIRLTKIGDQLINIAEIAWVQQGDMEDYYTLFFTGGAATPVLKSDWEKARKSAYATFEVTN